MANEIILILLIIGGFLGWTLFGYTVVQALCSRKKEIDMIAEISEELKKIKQDIKSLK